MSPETTQKSRYSPTYITNHLTAIKTYVTILSNKGVIGTLQV